MEGVGAVGGIVGMFSPNGTILALNFRPGAAVSGAFLFIIGTANSIILWGILKRRRKVAILLLPRFKLTINIRKRKEQ